MGHQIDWSATAAWIALAISIISPAITTILTNRHQLKLRELDIQEIPVHTMLLEPQPSKILFLKLVNAFLIQLLPLVKNVLKAFSTYMPILHSLYGHFWMI